MFRPDSLCIGAVLLPAFLAITLTSLQADDSVNQTHSEVNVKSGFFQNDKTSNVSISPRSDTKTKKTNVPSVESSDIQRKISKLKERGAARGNLAEGERSVRSPKLLQDSRGRAQGPSEQIKRNPNAISNVRSTIQRARTDSIGAGERKEALEFYKASLEKNKLRPIPSVTNEPADQRSVKKQFQPAEVPTSQAQAVTVTLVLSREPKADFNRRFDQLFKLKQHGKIAIKEILIIGDDLDRYRKLSEKEAKHWKKKGNHPSSGARQRKSISLQNFDKYFVHYGLRTMAETIEPLQITQSPAWLFSTEGKNYLFEGAWNATELFDADGNFLGSQSKTIEAINDGFINAVARRKGVKLDFEPSEKRPYANYVSVYTARDVGDDEVEDSDDYDRSGEHVSLPDCSSAKVDRLEVHQFSLQSNAMDYLFYNPEDFIQSEKADTWRAGKVIAYRKPIDSAASPYEERANLRVARSLGVTCLPTRFHLVSKGSKRFIEHRSGAKAWE